MNANIFRLVFSKRLGMLVPVAEQTISHAKGGASGVSSKHGCQKGGTSFLFKSIAFGIAMAFASPGFSLPTDPTAVNGTATFNQVGNVLTVTNSNKAIIDWQKFSIDAGETTRFLQSSASSSVLNRVLTNNPSQIYGTLSSNGRVWLINQAGILVGSGALIDTAGFVGSTLNVRAEDFLAGRLNFQATPGAGSVVNQGTITTPAGGSVYLVGPSVSNEGIINSPNGEVILAAGATVNLIDTATPGVKVEITGADNNATNLGSIVAEAGRIGIAGAIVRNSGTLDASSVVSEGGRIFLKASQDTYVDGNGRIVATGTKGGQVEVLGNRVAVMGNAEIDVSGTNGGGTILIGGDYQGKNPDVQNATITYFGPDATLKANATDNGDGGKVIVWADDTARAYGTIEAMGGPNGGNGGFVETSAHHLEALGIRVSTTAPKGKAGSWLLDPLDLTIEADYGGSVSCTYGGYECMFSSADGSVVDSYSIESALSNGSDVWITTLDTPTTGEGNIDVNANIYWSGSATLGLEAAGNINFNSVDISNSDGYGTLELYSNKNINFNNSSVEVGGDIFAFAKGNINIDYSTLTAYGLVGLAAGKDINIGMDGGEGYVYGYDVAMVAGLNVGEQALEGVQSEQDLAGLLSTGLTGNINIGNYSTVSAEGEGGIVGMVAGNINISNSYVSGDYFFGLAGGNITLSNGGYIYAYQEAYLMLSGSTSTLTLNPVADSQMESSKIYAGSPDTIYVDFLGRSAGGIVIDGVETTTSPGANGSGFFVNYEPAVLGQNLIVNYYAAPLVIEEVIKPIDPCLLTPEACQIDLGGLADLTGTGDQTTGGGDGEFGEGENKGKGKKSGTCKG